MACPLVYADGAYVVYRVLQLSWADRPSVLVSFLLVVAVSLTIGDATNRYGARHLVVSIETVDRPAELAAIFCHRLETLRAAMDLEEPTRRLHGHGSHPPAGPRGA